MKRIHVFAALALAAVLVLFISGNKEVTGELIGELDGSSPCVTAESMPACLEGICNTFCKDKYGNVDAVVGMCAYQSDSICNCVHPC